MSDNAFWAIVVSVISVCLTTMILGAMATYLATTRTTLPGHCGVVWVKEAK